jgi:hypothetical protein
MEIEKQLFYSHKKLTGKAFDDYMEWVGSLHSWWMQWRAQSGRLLS